MLKQIAQRTFSAQISPKFAENTVAGAYKRAVAANFRLDSVRFEAPNLNWNLKEFDRYSSAFAYGLIENGFQPGDKLLLWVDQTGSAEVLTAQMGAMKAGVQISIFTEQESQEQVHETLKASGARGFIFSPDSQSEGNNKRRDIFHNLFPELEGSYPGEPLNSSAYPNLKVIGQTGHDTIRGTSKFKDMMFYVNKEFTNLDLPTNSADSTVFEVYQNGKVAHSFSSAEIVDHAHRLFTDNFSDGEKIVPVAMPVDLQTPLGFATFLGNNLNGRKIFVPSNYNMTRIFRALDIQKSSQLVCDAEFYAQKPVESKKAEYHNLCQNVTKVIIADDGSSAADHSEIFEATVKKINAFSLQ